MHPFPYVGGTHKMLTKINHRYLAVIVVLGMIGCGNLVYACDPGFVEIHFTGKGRTNAITDSTSLFPASLGTLKVSSKAPYKIKLECGVRGVVTSDPAPGYDPDFDLLPGVPFNVFTTTFTSYIVCGDHSEAVVTSDATLQAGFCNPDEDPGIYAPGDPALPFPYLSINGPFEEPSTSVEGTWGLLKGATGSFDVSGTSSCGLQEWNVEATVCVDEDLLGD